MLICQSARYLCTLSNEILLVTILIQFFPDFLLQKMEHENHLLIVENKNLKNKMKNMENQMQDIKDTLSVEEFQCNLLTENLHSKLVRSDN